jgi:hypothetical protein
MNVDAEVPGASSFLDNVRIASPCPANWDEMIGDDRVRYCGQCTKNVYNLSAMAREDAEALLRAGLEREGLGGEGVCVRIYRRADGTVLTADCPDGARRKKRRLALFGAVGGGLMAATALGAELAGASATQGSPPPVRVMGAVAEPVHVMGEAPMMGQARDEPLAPDRAFATPPPVAKPPPVSPKSVPTTQVPPHGHWLGGAPAMPEAGRVSPRTMGAVRATF